MPAVPKRIRSDELAVHTEGLVQRYGRETVLSGVDLTVPEGAFYVLVGPNGAGKTTMLKVLLNLVARTAGTVRVLGRDPVREGPEVRARAGWVPERPGAGPTGLTVGSLLRLHAGYHASEWDPAYAARLAELLELRPATYYGRLSKGHARRVQLVAALAWRPRLLLLDEPMDGLDPVARDMFVSILADHLATSPTTVVLATHDVHEVEGLADHLGVLCQGGIVAQLGRDDLRRRLRRYRGIVPDGWRLPSELAAIVVRGRVEGRQGTWTVWGEEPEVIARLTAGGVRVTEATTLSLEGGTIELLASSAALAPTTMLAGVA